MGQKTKPFATFTTFDPMEDDYFVDKMDRIRVNEFTVGFQLKGFYGDRKPKILATFSLPDYKNEESPGRFLSFWIILCRAEMDEHPGSFYKAVFETVDQHESFVEYYPPDGLWADDLHGKSESYLHDYFYQVVKQDFYTAHEVEGYCFLPHEAYENRRVIADFMLYPRPHLVNAGFAETWLAVEIKAGGHFGKAIKQAFGYNYSAFLIKNRKVTPAFSVVWNHSYSSKPQLPRPSKSPEEAPLAWRDYESSLRSFAYQQGEIHSFGYMNIGVIVLNRGRINWQIEVGGRYAWRNFDHARILEPAYVDRSRKRFTARIGSGNAIDIASGLGKQA